MVENSTAVTEVDLKERLFAAVRRRRNWEQLAKFCLVGASGYVVNLTVYALLLRALGGC